MKYTRVAGTSTAATWTPAPSTSYIRAQHTSCQSPSHANPTRRFGDRYGDVPAGSEAALELRFTSTPVLVAVSALAPLFEKDGGRGLPTCCSSSCAQSKGSGCGGTALTRPACKLYCPSASPPGAKLHRGLVYEENGENEEE